MIDNEDAAGVVETVEFACWPTNSFSSDALSRGRGGWAMKLRLELNSLGISMLGGAATGAAISEVVGHSGRLAVIGWWPGIGCGAETPEFRIMIEDAG